MRQVLRNFAGTAKYLAGQPVAPKRRPSSIGGRGWPVLKSLLQLVELYDLLITALAVVLASVQIAAAALVALLTYAWFRAKAAAVAATVAARNVVKVDGENGARRMRLSLGSLFQWTVTANPDKGVAGGNVRLDFPIKSSLLLAACYLFLASVIGVASQFIVPGNFLFFGLHHLSKWARSLSRLRYLASLGAVDVEPSVRDAFTIRGTVSAAWRIYRSAPIRLTLITACSEIVSVTSLGLLAGPANAGLCAALHDAACAPDRRFYSYRFSAALAQPVVTTLCLAVTGALIAVGVPLVVTAIAIWVLVLFAFPMCVLEERGVLGSIRESAALVIRRPVKNLLVLLISALPFALMVPAGPLGIVGGVLYLPFALALLMAAYVAQRQRTIGNMITVRTDSDAPVMKDAA